MLDRILKRQAFSPVVAIDLTPHLGHGSITNGKKNNPHLSLVIKPCPHILLFNESLKANKTSANPSNNTRLLIRNTSATYEIGIANTPR